MASAESPESIPGIFVAIKETRHTGGESKLWHQLNSLEPPIVHQGLCYQEIFITVTSTWHLHSLNIKLQ